MDEIRNGRWRPVNAEPTSHSRDGDMARMHRPPFDRWPYCCPDDGLSWRHEMDAPPDRLPTWGQQADGPWATGSGPAT